MSALIGKKLNKYEIVEQLGRGGMAEVYKAFQPGVERYVAIKVLHCHLVQSTDSVARFLREARAVGRLRHPHIVQIVDADVDEGAQEQRYYMVMDYIEGETLGHYLQTRKRLAVVEALAIGLQLAEALAYAHRQGTIHRDIKPTNILLRRGAQPHVILTDFGLARLCDDDGTRLTMSGAMVGTPTYMSPEAVRGETCDERTDIYSLGVVLYELLTGKPPYIANTPYSMMMKLANDPLPPPRDLNPELPEAVETLLLCALAKEPTDRYADATAFGAAIVEAQQMIGGTTVQDPVKDHIATDRPSDTGQTQQYEVAWPPIAPPASAAQRVSPPMATTNPGNGWQVALALFAVAMISLFTIQFLMAM